MVHHYALYDERDGMRMVGFLFDTLLSSTVCVSAKVYTKVGTRVVIEIVDQPRDFDPCVTPPALSRPLTYLHTSTPRPQKRKGAGMFRRAVLVGREPRIPYS